MARPPQITPEILEPILRAHGPISATGLAERLGVNRTTIVRRLAGFGEDLVTLGVTRSTRYALRREVLAAGNSWPIYFVDEAGRAHLWGRLEAMYDRIWRIVWQGEAPAWTGRFSTAAGLWSGFPFFLTDIRPQGFLGRAIARRLSQLLGVPEDPRLWSDDHTLLFLQAAGDDLPGAVIVGEGCLRQALSPEAREPINEVDCERRYPELANEVIHSLPGSSAGGEQPKFITTVKGEDEERRSVLVKYSPPMDQSTGQRWADLLVCEWIALEVLSENGQTVSGARVLDSGGRRFLEVPRFDRVGNVGRRGVVSLSALHPEADSYGFHRAWVGAADELSGEGFVDGESVAAIRRLHSFGELIGNTDMHAGNLAFWLNDSIPFRLAPAFDMLPMLWAPGGHGEIVDRDFALRGPLPRVRSEWREAVIWAEEFWDRAANDSRLSNDFGDIARAARDSVKALRRREG